MSGPDFSEIGAELPEVIKPGQLARDEEKQFDLERVKEDHDHEIRKGSQSLGLIGNFFGTRDNALTYIVALFALLCMIGIAVFSYGNPELTKIAVEFFKAAAFACIGFITGKSLDKDK